MKIDLNSENYRNRVTESKVFLAASPDGKKSGEAGFSLIEVSIAMVIFLIAVLGVFISFAYAVNFNAGNSSRAQALALLQQKVEQMRSLKFVPNTIDDKLTGGEKTPDVVRAPDGNLYKLKVTVDDNPFMDGIQIDSTTKFKEVSVTVTLERPTPGWQTATPATVILRRVRGN